MTENNNLVTSTQGIIKEALHKLGFDDGMYDLIKNQLDFTSAHSSTNGRWDS